MDTTALHTTERAAESAWHRFWRLIMAPPLPPSELTPVQRRYEAFSAFPMFVVALLWMLSALFTWVPSIHEEYRHTGLMLSIWTWCVFVIDMLVRLTIDPNKKRFFQRNWPLLVALVFPPLRVLLVGSAVLRIRRDRNALTKIVGLYALYTVAFVVVLGAALTLAFEIDAPSSSIRSYGDAVWWGFETVTTVGYGDFTPVTTAGRGVAVLIMFTGAAAVGAVTAAVASRFISGGQKSSGSSAEQPGLDDVSRQLAALQEQIELIAGKLGVTGPDAPRS